MSQFANFEYTNSNPYTQSQSSPTLTKGFQKQINAQLPSNTFLLDDRNIFNKFSNSDEVIDTSFTNPNSNFGMPTIGCSTTSNKKGLLSTPYFSENNDQSDYDMLPK